MDSYYWLLSSFIFFFFNDTATTEIYTLSLHDALPIWPRPGGVHPGRLHPHERLPADHEGQHPEQPRLHGRSEEHTSELQSRRDLVCRLLLEKKKKKKHKQHTTTHHNNN